MKRFKLFILLLSGITLLFSCGKPTTPETVPIPDISGGYKVVTKYQTTGYAQDVVCRNNLAYIAQGEGGLEIVDITNLEDPQILSILIESLKGNSIKIEIKDDMVYLANGFYGVFGIDVSDPINPNQIFRRSDLEHAKNFHIMDNYLFIALSEDGVQIQNIKSPSKPEDRNDISTPGSSYGLAATTDSSLLMVASSELGLYIYDISDFQQGWAEYPQVAWCDTPGKAEEVILHEEDSVAFVACGVAGLQIIDYSDTTDVHIVGSFDGGGYAKDLMYKDNLIFMSVELSGLHIIDVTDFASPKLIGEIDTEFALGLDMDEDYIYLADEREGLIVIAKPE